MFPLFRRLWADDAGAVLAVEWTLLTGTTVFGVVGGMVAVRNATTAGFQRAADAISAVTPDPEQVRKTLAAPPVGPAVAVSNAVVVNLYLTAPPSP